MKESLILQSKDILKKTFLICDFIFEDDKKDRLNNSELETLEDFFIYFQTEENLANLVKLFNEGHYERYYDFKYGKGAFEEEIKLRIEPVTPAFLISRAIVNFFYGEESLRYEVEKFASDISSAYQLADKEDEEFIETIKINIQGQLKRLGY